MAGFAVDVDDDGFARFIPDPFSITLGLVVVVGVVAPALTDITVFGPLSLSTALVWTTFLAASLINLAVPSGGGQWAVQGPLIAETARVVAVDPAPLVMAFAWGDRLTNLLQPFRALPVLAITGLRSRDLLPTTALLCAVGLIVPSVGIVLFA